MARLKDGTGPPTKPRRDDEQHGAGCDRESNSGDLPGDAAAFRGSVRGVVHRWWTRRWVRFAALGVGSLTVGLAGSWLTFGVFLWPMATLFSLIVLGTVGVQQILERWLGRATAWAGVGVLWAVVTWFLASRTALLCTNEITGEAMVCSYEGAAEYLFFGGLLGLIFAGAKPLGSFLKTVMFNFANVGWNAVSAVMRTAGFAEPRRPQPKRVVLGGVCGIAGYVLGAVAGFQSLGAMLVAIIFASLPSLVRQARDRGRSRRDDAGKNTKTRRT